MSLPEEIRQLARDIESLAKAAPCYSTVWSIIQNNNDHILALARNIELRDSLEKTKAIQSETLRKWRLSWLPRWG
jgi:hypothetical protein